MSNNPAWAQEFKLTAANLEKWRKEAGPHEDLLRWCLLNGKINESQYLEWASLFYELPVVESQFFSLPADANFWDGVRGAGPWQPILFPLHEWQNVLLIACIEPQSQLELEKPHRFVLASARALNLLWTSLQAHFPEDVQNGIVDAKTSQSQQSTTSATTPIASTNKGVRPHPTTNDTSTATEPIKKSNAHNHEVAATSSDENHTDAPDGFLLKPHVGPKPSQNQEDPIAPLQFDTPDGLRPIASSSVSDAPAGLNIDLNRPAIEDEIPTQDSLDFPNSDPMDEASPPPPVIATATMMPQTPRKAPPRPPPPPKRQNDAPAGSTTPENFPRAPSSPSGVKIPAAPGAYNTTVVHKFKEVTVTRTMDVTPPVEPSKTGLAQRTVEVGQKRKKSPTSFEQCASYDDIANVAFAQIMETFEMAVLLTFQSGQLRPWKWTPNMPVSVKDRPSTIDLNSPSIFRIVYSTCMPFHGAIAPNDINTAFFAEMNSGETPTHATIMPILILGQIAGMIMGMTSQPIHYRDSLKKMELITEGVSQAFQRIRNTRAA